MRWLLQHGASIVERDAVGNTALLYSVYGGHRHVVEELVSLGRSLGERNSKNHTVLLQVGRDAVHCPSAWSVWIRKGYVQGSTNRPQSAADRRAQPSKPGLIGAHPAPPCLLPLLLILLLTQASCGGHKELVRWMLDSGHRLDETDRDGNTALLFAAYVMA